MAARTTWSTVGRAVAAVLVGLVVVVAAVVVTGLDVWLVLLGVLVVCLAITIGVVARLRRERARLRVDVDELEVSAALLTERVRIAREVHDLVSHGLGMITVRASSALHLAEMDSTTEMTDREQSLALALSDVEKASRNATEELRCTLTTLRDPQDVSRRQLAVESVEGLEAIPKIVDGARAAGLEVALRYDKRLDIPAALYPVFTSVVREGLSNAARHAGPTDVTVDLADDQHGYSVSVRDAGPAGHWRARPGSGNGLNGLAERVDALGGQLHFGPEGDGYVLCAGFKKNGQQP